VRKRARVAAMADPARERAWGPGAESTAAGRVKDASQLVGSAQILTWVWGPGFSQRTNYLRFHMARLRRKLEDNPARPRHPLAIHQYVTAAGRVRAVHDFGAGDMLEIARPEGPPIMVPFTRAIVPDIDFVARRLVLDPPAGLFDARVDARVAPLAGAHHDDSEEPA